MVIVVGHTRWKAAKRLGLKRVPVHVAADLTPAQARAYRLTDNRTNEAAWIAELLSTELAAARDEGSDLALTGFTDREIAKALDVQESEGSGSSPSEMSEDLEYRIVIDCEGEVQQATLIERFEKQGLTCRALIS